jgi:hypothetical protein
MAFQVQEAYCVLWGHKSASVVTAKRRFCTECGRDLPMKMSIYKWCKLLSEARCIFIGKSPGKWPLTRAKVNENQTSFVSSSRNATSRHAVINSAKIL